MRKSCVLYFRHFWQANSTQDNDEDFGIRLEDDVVINSSGDPTNLMKNIPIQIEEIEAIMNNS